MAGDITKKWARYLEIVDYAFQPIVNIHTGAIYGYEALIRKVEEAGFESIPDFFDDAFNHHILGPVHQHLFMAAFDKISRFSWEGRAKLFFNIDSRLFHFAEFHPEKVLDLLENRRVPKDRVCLELSEKHPICEADNLIGKLKMLRNLGCSIAVDDFGTGFSGTQLLYFTKPEYVKIDRFYIQNIENDTNKRLLASSMVKIAHLMGSLVIAEGVETEAEYWCCKTIGCDLLQGYLVQKPTLDIGKLRTSYDYIHDLTASEKRNEAAKDKALIQARIVYLEPIDYETKLVSLLEIFKKNQKQTYLPVVTHNSKPLGIIREESIKVFAYSEYGRSLLLNPTFGRTIDDFMSRIPMVDIHTPVEEILETFLSHENLEGIMITNSMKYVGFLTAHSLLKMVNEKKLAQAADQNPLSKLPGNKMIYEYLSKALHNVDEAYVISYFDFDYFKVYNDKYGFRQGDRVILLFAELLKSRAQSADRFAGHIGGDDFFLGVKGQPLSINEQEIWEIGETFRINVESFYDTKAIEQGCIEGKGRDGRKQCFPLITVSAGVLKMPVATSRIQTPEEIGNIMADMKKKAKQSPDHIATSILNSVTESTTDSDTEPTVIPFDSRRAPVYRSTAS